MMKTQIVPSISTSLVEVNPSTSEEVLLDQLNYIQLPEDIICRIGSYVPPIDRLRLQLVCKRFRTLLSNWPDISALEIRSESDDCGI